MYSEQFFDSLRHLETRRLILRRMTLRDAPDMFEYSRDPLVARHVLWDAHRNIGQTRSYIRSVTHNYRAGKPASLVIEYKPEHKVIGTIGFMWYCEDSRSAEVGYSLSRQYWNQGLMTEALAKLIEYGFTRLRLNRIEGQHETDNPSSGRVMRKAGMVHEGTLRQRLYNKGRFVDMELYALLRQDYEARRAGTDATQC